MGQTASIGKCNFCGQAFSKSGMARHLVTCKARKTAIEAENLSNKKLEEIFHLAISGEYVKDYWLHLEIRSRSKLHDLDQFLRDIWLECCGHLSMFIIEDHRYLNNTNFIDYEDYDMNVSLGQVLQPEMVFRHEYDFGSTTELVGKVIDVREGVWTQRDPIRILARNDQPRILCDRCGQQMATMVCTMCIHTEKAWFCDSCAAQHECGIDYMLPVVNSPRVGICGYTGEPA